MEEKHIALLSIAVVAVVAIIGGLTYALWSSTSTQTGDNVITTGCFNITFEETAGSDINLQNAYPITDSDGMGTTPYEFTIENTCELAANYAVNFEVAGESTLSSDYLKATLNTNTPQILSDYTTTTATIAGRSAYQLTTGILAAGVKESYTFRMWLDEDAPQAEAQSKSLSGKIVITTTPIASTATLVGKISAYYPQYETTVQLVQEGSVKYSTVLPAVSSTSESRNRTFQIDGVKPGTYNLVVTKAHNFTYTVNNVVLSEGTTDLTTMTDKGYATIYLIGEDINEDGMINNDDAAIINSIVARLDSKDNYPNADTDVDGDGLTTVSDASLMGQIRVVDYGNKDSVTIADCTFDF